MQVRSMKTENFDENRVFGESEVKFFSKTDFT